MSVSMISTAATLSVVARARALYPKLRRPVVPREICHVGASMTASKPRPKLA
jgi:hypothetical protein